MINNLFIKTVFLKSGTKFQFGFLIFLIFTFAGFQNVWAEKKTAKVHRHEKRKSTAQKKVKRYVSNSSNKNVKNVTKVKPQITNIERVYEGAEYVVKIRARKFKQGELMYVRLLPNSPDIDSNSIQRYNLYWMKKKVEMFVFNNEYAAFIPIHPELKPGTYDLEIRLNEQNDLYKVCPVQIEANKFKVTKVTENLKLPKRFAPSKGGGGSFKFIQECEKIKKMAFQSETIPSFSQNFHLPAKIKKITSNFYARRNYFTRKGKPHGGIDIRGKSGDPIHAIQDGKVVISRPMFFEGIFTVIDHGSKIFSLYMHQSETIVKEGDNVKRGQLIGRIGSTGMSTGPHLHLGLKVNNILVNPMSLIHLKIF